ncbi:FAD-binding oxidoreductase [Burkholderia ambifaria]|uniref:FAD dependent oxidoreductase n=1 Tax=Burkholderia ambifaria (strain ATCC BAA-244 / DSM 16087 / CCUG 44356 / LMG 19182 / AMMD) TaxID=339670 RepID=Q0B3Z8_BURCM|nr:FAD-binding oxidoreductase [Burkholderia ambifaria]ABI91125.1 FAD dependent oxidoreductase [Burkholderia ambifaria AMMD]MBR7933830.1 FAD-binding oxidoreductase [Burkholderia ambifaria]PEH70049.1 FAD-binding oxidoreductase [Burkholderia ambifaria]QQC08782.1 FAD-binding oxidoreductase [Burkholderia ambifaria]UZU00722.1 FAD-binding oxidoreductase [Burkholderia ambifaria]
MNLAEVEVAKPLPPSLWAATAEPAVVTPRLDSSTVVDVTIVGAGYTGLSTALHLAEQGLRVCVIDANEPGWGASGRNGGQVIPGLKYDPDELIRRYGPHDGNALVQMAGGAADTVFDLVARHGIRCDATRAGWIQPTHSHKLLKTLYARAGQWEARGAPVELLDRAQVSKRLGTDAFVGGWVDRRAGSVQPLSYARGLARAAQAAGAEIHGGTRAAGVERGANGWRIRTAHGPVIESKQVLLATNGYTDGLWPRLAQSVIAANSFIVATKPLADDVGATILAGGEVTSDSRRLLLYFRKDADGRLLMGGRGPFRDPRSAGDWVHLERAAQLMFPHIKDIEFEFRWAGRIAITRNFLPHVHVPAEGMTIALGYNGRGIAMATTLGKHLAALIGGTTRGLPLPPTSIEPVPFHALQRLYISAGVAWYGLLDALS